MKLMLGIDTGGTFTDAVVMAVPAARASADPAAAADPGPVESSPLVAAAKAPTTHGDLAVGIEAAVRAVLGQPGVAAERIGLVSLSTTLATNALVEGQGEPVCLIAAGFGPADLDRIGIEPGRHDLLVTVSGGHDAMGRELAPIDPIQLAQVAADTAPVVSAYAVATQFSVRNPAHELAIARLLADATGRPVTCSHELSARLNGPRRALTTLLNARLIGVMGGLNQAVATALASVGIDAPLMVVRGDGSLAAAEFVARRPIETILSGPAASVIGAHHLAGAVDGLVVDIGGTTTDIAPVRAGQPAVTSDGAVVAGHRTMIEAVDLRTHGLGGDSEVVVDPSAPGLVLGPGRAVPLCRLAGEFPQVSTILGRQLAGPAAHGQGRLLVAVGPRRVAPDPNGTADSSDQPIDSSDQPIDRLARTAGLDRREQAVLAALAAGPAAELEVATSRLLAQAVTRLRRRGLVRVATITPTDAARLLGHLDQGDLDAARLGAELLARQSDSRGRPMAGTAVELATLVGDRLVARSAECVLEAALANDGFDGPAVVAGPLIQAALAGHHGLVSARVAVTGPVVAVGASAPTWYPSVAAILGTSVVLSPHGAVANAVGAAVAPIRVRRQVTVVQPRTGTFLVHAGSQPRFHDLDQARRWAEDHLRVEVTDLARSAGATEVVIELGWNARSALVNSRETLVEATVSATATGRPDLS